MKKTKLAKWFVCAVVLSAAASCQEPHAVASPAVQGLRPIGPILSMRMTPLRTKSVTNARSVLRAPDSYVQWRVEAIAFEILGDQANHLSVSVERQSAVLTGAIPTGWQAADLVARLEAVEQLRSADLRFRVLDPDAARPLNTLLDESSESTPD